MRLNRPALHFIGSIAADRQHARACISAIHALIQSRRSYLWLLLLPLLFAPTLRCRKLQLWRFIAALSVGLCASRRLCCSVECALSSTYAYQDAIRGIRRHPALPFARGSDYQHFLSRLRHLSPRRLILFHHHDSRGRVPSSWVEFLSACVQSGFYVILTTSNIRASDLALLNGLGVETLRRSNFGRCLGSYKDALLVLGTDPFVLANLRSVILCNDSTLPVLGPDHLLGQIHHWINLFEEADRCVLAGLTDCAQRSAYHLQSYFLYANSKLLCNHAWARFWLDFTPSNHKDQLIDDGEIGLSRALLADGVDLCAAYPMIQSLLDVRAARSELRDHPSVVTNDINQTLHLWQTLLGMGFPLIKKQLLFGDFRQHQGGIALARLAPFVPSERRDMLFEDIHELYVSRFCRSDL